MNSMIIEHEGVKCLIISSCLNGRERSSFVGYCSYYEIPLTVIKTKIKASGMVNQYYYTRKVKILSREHFNYIKNHANENYIGVNPLYRKELLPSVIEKLDNLFKKHKL